MNCVEIDCVTSLRRRASLCSAHANTYFHLKHAANFIGAKSPHGTMGPDVAPSLLMMLLRLSMMKSCLSRCVLMWVPGT